MIDQQGNGEDTREHWLLDDTKCEGCDCTRLQIAECPDAQAKGRRMAQLGQRGDPC